MWRKVIQLLIPTPGIKMGRRLALPNPSLSETYSHTMGAPTRVKLKTLSGLENLRRFKFLFNVGFLNSCIRSQCVHACPMLWSRKTCRLIHFQIAQGARLFPPVQMLTWKWANLWHCLVSLTPTQLQEVTLGTATATRTRMTQTCRGQIRPWPSRRSEELTKRATRAVQPMSSAQGRRASPCAYLYTVSNFGEMAHNMFDSCMLLCTAKVKKNKKKKENNLPDDSLRAASQPFDATLMSQHCNFKHRGVSWGFKSLSTCLLMPHQSLI